MQSVPIVEIIEQVKIILNENIKEDAFLLEDSSQLELDELIRSLILDAVRMVHETAPIELFSGDVMPTTSIETKANGTGQLDLPLDFMRLVIFELETWGIPVVEAITDTHPMYLQQRSKFIGVRGGMSKPVCAVSTGVTGNKILEFYSVAPGAAAVVKKARYIPLPSFDGLNVNVASKLKTSIYYQCAGLVALSLKDESSSDLFGLSKTYNNF